jgi:Fe-S oxidoreductase
VSNAEPRETITPWGKMSLSWMVAHGDVPFDRPHAAPAWACTGCFACREWCDHRNPVADVLLDARDAMWERDLAPAGAVDHVRRFLHHDDKTRARSLELATHPRVQSDAPDALLIGCGYLRAARREAREAIDAAVALLRGPVALVTRCCGLPLRLAGDRRSFAAQARTVARALDGRRRIIAVDSGCAFALSRLYPQVGVTLSARVEPLVEVAAANLGALSIVSHSGQPVRWHDPCQLGRGLGAYDAPRAVLARVLGHPADEFAEHHEQAVCSGAGGLLPSTMPGVARAIADARVEAHRRAGGGRVVTACASSLLGLRKRGRRSGVVVDDLVTWIARALA